MLIELVIDKIVYGGDGIGNYNGVKVFVPYSVPQDRVLIAIKKKKKNYYIGQIKEIIEPSPFRVTPLCPHFLSCGGCQLQHLKYDYQLVVKKLIANETLQRIGKVFFPAKNPLPAPSEWHYRNKTQYPLAPPHKIGFFKRQTHQVIDIEKCLLHPTTFDEIKSFLKNSIKKAGETVYDEIKHSGNIRHIIIRKGFNTNQYLVIIVTQEASLARGVYEELPKSFDGIVGVVQNRNPVKTNRILGDEYKKLIGQDYYFETVLNKRFRISAGSFFQVNTAQTETLVKQVIKLLAPTGQERVLDLFAGVGTFTIPLADFVDKVTGIEINRIAVLDANESLRINTINNVEFIAAPAEQGIKNFQQVDAVILDPPRKGCGKELIEGIAGLRPKKIIYISCNPTTLARDLAIFDHIGYEVSAIELVDLFPQTYHIEAVAKIVPKL